MSLLENVRLPKLGTCHTFGQTTVLFKVEQVPCWPAILRVVAQFLYHPPILVVMSTLNDKQRADSLRCLPFAENTQSKKL